MTNPTTKTIRRHQKLTRSSSKLFTMALNILNYQLLKEMIRFLIFMIELWAQCDKRFPLMGQCWQLNLSADFVNETSVALWNDAISCRYSMAL